MVRSMAQYQHGRMAGRIASGRDLAYGVPRALYVRLYCHGFKALRILTGQAGPPPDDELRSLAAMYGARLLAA
jgi:hypothetical protein